MPHAIQSNHRYYDENFHTLNFVEQSFVDVTFENCHFQRCNLQQTVFKDCYFENCTFEDSNCSVINLKGTKIFDCLFRECKLYGIKWFLTNHHLGFSVEFEECDLSLSSFTGLDLKKIKISKSNCREVYFDSCNMTKSLLTKNNFEGSVFHHTNLEKANFTDSFNYTIDPLSNNIKKAIFKMPEAIGLIKPLNIVLEE